MLRELRISNFAIIDALQLPFEPGMNVLTGETGAGKSIIMRALGLLCGERATSDLIRTDCDEATIEGLFDIHDTERAIFEESGVPPADELLIRRVINRAGKGRVWVNGALSTAAVLSQLGTRLIHVYGQHEHALLLKPESHLDFLDEFGKLAALRTEMAAAYAAFRAAADRLAELTAGGEGARQRLELLHFQVQELRDAKLVRGDEQRLQQERERQRHAEKLSLICRQSEAALYSGDQAIAAALSRIANQLHDAGRIEASFDATAETLRQAVVQVEEVALDLRRAAERIRHDPERLEQIEERLALLARLKRKYGGDADALVDRLADLETELGAIEGNGVDLNAVRQTARESAARAWAVAGELSRARQAVAPELERRVAAELALLGMRDATFQVTFTVVASDGPPPRSADVIRNPPASAECSDPTRPPEASGVRAGSGPAEKTPTAGPFGGDVVQFYLSANPGEDPKPLARIASGGELSRIMLALKTLTAGAGEVPTLIFDEVDAGIGGAVAEAVGERLRVVGHSRQVLCITHLPQIAAQADHHFAVEKRVVKGRTTTRARALQADDRVREITRMLGGTSTAESQQYARRLMAGVGKAARR